jgi:hypothetical protein
MANARDKLLALRAAFEDLVSRAEKLSTDRGLSAGMRGQLAEFARYHLHDARYLLTPMVGARAYTQWGKPVREVANG